MRWTCAAQLCRTGRCHRQRELERLAASARQRSAGAERTPATAPSLSCGAWRGPILQRAAQEARLQGGVSVSNPECRPPQPAAAARFRARACGRSCAAPPAGRVSRRPHRRADEPRPHRGGVLREGCFRVRLVSRLGARSVVAAPRRARASATYTGARAAKVARTPCRRACQRRLRVAASAASGSPWPRTHPGELAALAQVADVTHARVTSRAALIGHHRLRTLLARYAAVSFAWPVWPVAARGTPGWSRGRRPRGGAPKTASRVVNAVAGRVASRIVSRFLQRFVRKVEGEEVAAVRVVLQEGALVLHNLDLNLSGAAQLRAGGPTTPGSPAEPRTQLSSLPAVPRPWSAPSRRSCASLCRGPASALTHSRCGPPLRAAPPRQAR